MVPRIPLAALWTGLLLSGCAQPAPVAPGYGYAPGGPPPGQPYAGPDGLPYVDGYPADALDGGPPAFVFAPALGGWGYYDGQRRWRGAPPDMRDRLERSHPGGRGLPPPGFGEGPRRGFDRPPGRPEFGGYAPGRPGGPPPGRPVPAGYPGRPGFAGGPPPGQQGRPGPQPGGGRPPPQQRGCQPGQPRC